MSIFEKYEVGNLVKYNDKGLAYNSNNIAKITKIINDKTEYELEILSLKQTINYFIDDNDANVEPIYLDFEALQKLGFKSREDAITWDNGVIELISNTTMEVEELNPIISKNMSQMPNITFKNRGYKVKNLFENKIILTSDEDELNINMLHELQNIYSQQIKFSELDLSAFS